MSQTLRTGIADSFETQLRSTRGLTPAEVNTEAFVMVRMWRASGVKRLWHDHRDALENLRDPLIPLMTLFSTIAMLETRSFAETGLRWLSGIITVRKERYESCKKESGRWLSGSRIKHSTQRMGEPSTGERS